MTSPVDASLIAAHRTDANAATQLSGAFTLERDADGQTRVAATLNLATAASTLSSAVGGVTDPTAQAILQAVASFAANLSLTVDSDGQASVARGLSGGAAGGTATAPTSPTEKPTRTAFTQSATATAPTGVSDVQAGIAALQNAYGQVALGGGINAQAALPMIGGLLNLAIQADEKGLSWQAGVMLPFATGVALTVGASGSPAPQDAPNPTGLARPLTTPDERRAEVALGFAARVAARPVALAPGTAPTTAYAQPGDTPVRLATRHLGDGARWTEITALNRLDSPYVVDDPAPFDAAGLKVLAPGRPFLVPGATGQDTDPAARGGSAAASLHRLESDTYGIDLAWQPRSQWLTLDGTHLTLDRGVVNLAKALYRRIITRVGALPAHPQYGDRAFDHLGLEASAYRVRLATLDLQAALQADPRVVSVTVTGEADGDGVLSITAFVTPIPPSEAFTVTARIGGS